VTRRPPRVPGTPGAPLRAVYVLPSIPDDAPEAYKQAVAIRNVASRTGVCPECGVRGELTGPDRHGIMHLTFLHEDECRALRDGDEDAA
jgi:hypothetical protein